MFASSFSVELPNPDTSVNLKKIFYYLHYNKKIKCPTSCDDAKLFQMEIADVINHFDIEDSFSINQWKKSLDELYKGIVICRFGEQGCDVKKHQECWPSDWVSTVGPSTMLRFNLNGLIDRIHALLDLVQSQMLLKLPVLEDYVQSNFVSIVQILVGQSWTCPLGLHSNLDKLEKNINGILFDQAPCWIGFGEKELEESCKQECQWRPDWSEVHQHKLCSDHKTCLAENGWLIEEAIYSLINSTPAPETVNKEKAVLIDIFIKKAMFLSEGPSVMAPTKRPREEEESNLTNKTKKKKKKEKSKSDDDDEHKKKKSKAGDDQQNKKKKKKNKHKQKKTVEQVSVKRLKFSQTNVTPCGDKCKQGKCDIWKQLLVQYLQQHSNNCLLQGMGVKDSEYWLSTSDLANHLKEYKLDNGKLSDKVSKSSKANMVKYFTRRPKKDAQNAKNPSHVREFPPDFPVGLEGDESKPVWVASKGGRDMVCKNPDLDVIPMVHFFRMSPQVVCCVEK